MNSIGLFFGSDTGATEDVASRIQKMWGNDDIVVKDILQAEPADIGAFEKLIIGSSTWNDGELVSGWFDFFPKLDQIDFAGKTVAIFGVGDQYSYGDWYCDAIGILAQKIRERGGRLIGFWLTEGYDFVSSKAVEDGRFLGLALDETNQAELTDQRLEVWIEQIKREFYGAEIGKESVKNQ